MEHLDILKNISWMINEHPSEAKIYINQDYDNPLPLSEETKNQMIFEEEIHIELPTHRFAESFQRILVKRPCNIENILTAVYNFYNKNIPEHGLDNVPNDLWNYVTTAKEKMNSGESVKWIDIMGDLIFFEGLYKQEATADKTENNIYELILGS